MVTEVLINYVDDERVETNKKCDYLRNLNLPYSDIFYLMNLYNGNSEIYRMVQSLLMFDNTALKEQIKKQERKTRKSKKHKKMRFMRSVKSYD